MGFLDDPLDISGRKGQERAIESQEAQNLAEREQRLELADRARDDLFRIFPQAQQTRRQGFQGALDVFGQTIPQQLQVFQGGNVAAQEQLLAGLPQFQNAILGNPVDLSVLQPTRLGFDAGFAQQQLPAGPLITAPPPPDPNAPIVDTPRGFGTFSIFNNEDFG